LDQHKTIDALEIVAEIFIYSARRADLQLLQEATKNWLEAFEIVQDAVFGVQQRSLN